MRIIQLRPPFQYRTVFFALCLFGVSLPSVAQTKKPPIKKPPIEVIATTVKNANISDQVEVLGTLLANESINVTATVTEQITHIHFEDNQAVAQGDLLVEMDIAEENAELNEQQSVLLEAEKQIQRLQPLVKKGAASASALDTAKLNAAAAKARIEAIKARINLRIIKAPFSGTLGLREISPGALVQPNTRITTLDDLSVMKLDFWVPEVFLSSLKNGVMISATTDAFPNDVFEGKISSIDSRINPVSRAIKARALLENPQQRLKPGLLMTIILHKNQRTSLTLLEEAVMMAGDQHHVYLITTLNDTLTTVKQPITVGSRYNGRVEILTGLKAGDKVVTHGLIKIRPGAPIKILTQDQGQQPLTTLLQREQNELQSGQNELKKGQPD